MIISSSLGTDILTYYTITFIIIIQLEFGLVSSATQFIFSFASSLLSLELKYEVIKIYKNATKYSALISAILTTGFLVLGYKFIEFWMGSDFAKNTKDLIPIIAMVFFFQSVSIPAFYVYNGLGFSNINMLSALIWSATYLVFAFILIPPFIQRNKEAIFMRIGVCLIK